MATVNYYLDTRREKKDGTYPIKLLVRHNDKFLVSTDYTATKDAWNKNQYTKEAPNYKARNVAIRNLISRVETLLLSLDQSGNLKYMTDKQLKALIEEVRGGKCPERKAFYRLSG